MRNFFEHKTAVFLIAATLVIAVVIGIFSATAARDKAGAAENLLGAATEPGQAAATGIGGWFHGIFQYFGSVKALRAENEELKRANVELDKQVRDAQGMEQENQELRAMLNLMKTENKLDLVAAQVIAKDPSNWYSSFTINKGTDDGIQKNQPVLTANKELVGQVYKVGSSWAEIITILDPDSGVGSLIERSKDIGIIEGDASLRHQGLCRLGYLSRETDIEVGDYVETSGMGGIYPKGLLIGTVLDIREDNTNMSKYATIKPIVELGKLTQVCVLKNFVEEIKRDAETPDMGAQKDADNTSGTEQDEDEDEDTVSSGSSTGSKNTENVSSGKSTPKATATQSSGSRSSMSSGSNNSSSSGNSGTSQRQSSSETESNSSGSSAGSSNENTSGNKGAGTMNGSELRD